MTGTTTADLVLRADAIVGESPVWDEWDQVLWWVDIEGRTLNQVDPGSGINVQIDVGQLIGCVARCRSGKLLLALQDGFAMFDPAKKSSQPICDPEAHLPHNRFNDGKCDPAGRFWAGTMNVESSQRRSGALYSLDEHFVVVKHLSSIGVSNGIAWTADSNTMYYADSLVGTVDAFDFNLADGRISNRRTVFEHAGHWTAVANCDNRRRGSARSACPAAGGASLSACGPACRVGFGWKPATLGSVTE